MKRGIGRPLLDISVARNESVDSNYVWLAGLVLVVIAIYQLWSIRLNTLEQQRHAINHGDDSSTSCEVPRRSYPGMPSFVPAAPIKVAEEDVPETRQIDEVRENVTPDSNQVREEADMLDDPEVSMHLRLASQLQVVGDFEGTDYYAKLALEHQHASPKQKERAHNLLRRDSIL